jgi:proline dehydrogenase
MSLGRNILLWGSKNEWMKNNVPKFTFVQKAVKRFMPGEKVEDAIKAAGELSTKNISTTFTYLGENINNLSEGELVKDHYLVLLYKINESNLDIEISLKLTQLGFDISFDKTLEFFKEITRKAKEYNNNVFIDIEDSSYVDKTIEFYVKMKEEFDNVGLCLQSYLYRTMDDIKNMLPINPWIRLVKGAYKEPPDIAFPSKKEVDDNFLKISKFLLRQTKENGIRIAYGTHDLKLQEQIKIEADKIGIGKNKVEFQMLFGIKSMEQLKLAEEGYDIRTLISYGEHWYPWYMRRLAERPANIGFVLKNIIS